MRGTRFDGLLAGTTLALVLACGGLPATAATTSDAKIEALVPIPEPANVPPPTASDVGAPTPPAEPSTTQALPSASPSTPSSATAPDVAPPPDAAGPASSEPAAAAAPASEPDKATSQPPTAVAPASEPDKATSQPATAVAPASEPDKATSQPATAVAPASEPDKAAAAPPVAPSLDQQVADKLRADFAKPGHKDKAVEAFYAARNFAPLWVVNGVADERAAAARAFIAKVDADGLDPSDYPLPEFKSGSDPATLADAELKFTSTILTYARHASHGRVAWSRVSADISYAPRPFEPAEALAQIADSKDIAAALDSFNPQQPGYKALKAKLAEARGLKDAGPVHIATGPVLRIVSGRRGKRTLMEDPRVPQLRQRLGLPAVANNSDYDQPLANAVKAFQRQHDLPANGHLTTATVEALNGMKRGRLADIIIANMERWRWLPRDLGKAYVMLNIPDYTLKVVKDGATIWKTRVVVGQPAKPTPILTETMKYITINPTWNVPPSIVYNEYLPALQQDPTVLDRMGLKLEQDRDGSVHISQPPGAGNALGRIRFNFPNKFLVYQHDTPDKYLFAKERRAYSHGCMRVQDPAKYAEILLNIALPHEGWTVERITSMYGTTEHDIKFPTPIPVHITYQTAFVDDAGKLQLRDDVYGRDARILALLKGDERKVADIPIERPQPNYSRPPVRLPDRYAGAGFGSGNSGGGLSFFERLFGGGPPEPPAPVIRHSRRYAR